jgi:PPK2 family polyphosphate:nucleotide phosphotransferase
MKLDHSVVEELRVVPGSPAHLATRGTGETKSHWLERAGRSGEKGVAEKDLTDFKDELDTAQQLLYASRSYALLVIFQGLDAAGKDGTIKHVMSGVNPQGCAVFSFREPTREELAHDYLWRCSRVLPERGRIAIFNRSYYEDVIVVRVHPDLLGPENLPTGHSSGEALWTKRYEDINAFERHLHRNGTRIVKFFLHISKDVQKKRILKRLDDPTRYWKYSPSDLAERAYFDDYQRVYEEAITATSTDSAPWYVIPADHKAAMRAMVGGVLAHAIDRMGLRLPEPDEDARRAMEEAKRSLLAE